MFTHKTRSPAGRPATALMSRCWAVGACPTSTLSILPLCAPDRVVRTARTETTAGASQRPHRSKMAKENTLTCSGSCSNGCPTPLSMEAQRKTETLTSAVKTLNNRTPRMSMADNNPLALTGPDIGPILTTRP